ncbi:MAG: carbohydrate kinase [Spirochaetia bacterium]|nr:carbohydrate kinase [Spirochaetia bacterium]
MKKTGVTAFGEILVDMLPEQSPKPDLMFFSANAGGAPANVAVAVARLGVPSAFIGKTGRDAFGEYLRKILADNGVDVTGLVTDPWAPTTEALVSLTAAGERSFSFYRTGCADALFRSDELNTAVIADSKIFHFGSLSMTEEPVLSATRFAVETARKNGSLISFDPNYRPTLWTSPEEARNRIESVLGSVDIMKVSEEEAEWLTGEKSVEKAAAALRTYGISLVFVTLGARGAFFSGKKAEGSVQSPDICCVDTTGAGDSFFGAVLASLSRFNKEEIKNGLDKSILEKMTFYANCAATLTVSRKGAIPALPTESEVKTFFKM